MRPPQYDDNEENGRNGWEAAAWVYFIWVVIEPRVYLKIGYSVNPTNRYKQLISGLPERPYMIHLLSCLNVEQAKLFERMLHDHLKGYRTRGEWFSHLNIKHLYKVVRVKMWEIFSLFHTFGYEPDLEQIDLDGLRPVLRASGYISHLYGSTWEDEEEEE